MVATAVGTKILHGHLFDGNGRCIDKFVQDFVVFEKSVGGGFEGVGFRSEGGKEFWIGFESGMGKNAGGKEVLGFFK